MHVSVLALSSLDGELLESRKHSACLIRYLVNTYGIEECITALTEQYVAGNFFFNLSPISQGHHAQ